jgi:cystathionine beta-lyase/cystathionine gamma-synthase
MNTNGFNSKCVHSGDMEIEGVGNVVTPIFENSTFEFPESGVVGNYIYSRWGNPTVNSFEKKYADLEHTEHAFAFSTGMAAITSSVMPYLKAGDSVLALNELYGQTFEFFSKILPQYKINVDFTTVNELNRLDFKNKNYKILYVESITNPLLEVPDIINLAKICRENGIKLLVDATFATPYNQNPVSLGADVALHSGTKYISGHSDLLIGLAGFNDNYDNLDFYRKTFGGTPDAFQAFLAYRGLKTLGLRMERHNHNAMELARVLNESKKIEEVYYPGLKNSEYFDVAGKNLKGFGGMVSFKVKGGIENSHKLINNLNLAKYAVSLGGVESLVSIPVEGTHKALSLEERKASGITDNLVRLSVGIEDIEDLLKDFENAMDKI